MFNLKFFIVTNIVNGIKNGTFTKEYGNIMAVNYYAKGIIGAEEIMEIDLQITEWEASKNVVEEPEVPIEPEVVEPEVVDPETEIPSEQPEESIEPEIEEPIEEPTEQEGEESTEEELVEPETDALE